MIRAKSSGKYILSIRSITLVLLFLLLQSSLQGQKSSGGTPVSLLFNIEDTRVYYWLQQPDIQTISDEDIRQPLPYRFAVLLKGNIGMPGNGEWTILPDGSSIWRISIQAPGAKALSLYFDKFYIPAGGRLFLYDPLKKKVLGAFTAENNRADSLFATELVPGEVVTLEYFRPRPTDAPPVLHISEIAYAYRGGPDPDGFHPVGTAGPCEVNINCPEGASWQDEKRGVIRIQTKKFGGSYWCSGTLINNTRQDGTPYVLTADHCGQGATIEDYSQWVFYFGHEGDLCQNPNPPPTTQSLTGSTVKASSGDVQQNGSDFLLLLLDEPVPGTWNPYFNGWNRKDNPSPSGVTIHHPQGDIRKISTYTTPVSSTTWAMPGVYTHWRVKWSATTNGHGVTEGGSSGSPLFDNNGSIIGSLTGGESSCDSINLDKPDYYGKFSYSWNTNGSDSSKQLSYWLDPLGSGIEILGGIALGGISQGIVKREMTVFPNPFSSILSISLSAPTVNMNVHVEIIDLRGKIIFKEETRFTTTTPSFNLSWLDPGIYLIRIYDNETIFYQKIIKN